MTLKYIVWLGISGRKDGDPMFIPGTTADRLKMLLELESAWENLAPRRVESLKVVPRIYPESINLQNGMIDYYADESSGVAQLCLQKLPSIVSPVAKLGEPSQFRVWWAPHNDEPTWDLHQTKLFVRVRFGDFPPESLVDLVYLKDLQDPSFPPPRVRISEIPAAALQLLPPPGAGPNTVFDLQRCTIHGDFLLFEIEARPLLEAKDGALCLVLWNWVESALANRFWLDPFWWTNQHPYACEMLDSSTVIVVHNRTLLSPFIAVRVYTIPKEGGSESYGMAPILQRTLLLPEIGEKSNLDITFTVSGLEESPIWSSTDSSNQFHMRSNLPEDLKPFGSADATRNRLCQIRLTSHERSNNRRRLYTWRFVFLAGTLLCDYDGDVVPWEQWGAPNAACFHGVPTILGPDGDGPIEAMAGSRLARLHAPSSDVEGEGHEVKRQCHILEILDFSKCRVWRHMSPRSWPEALSIPDSAAYLLGDAPAQHDTAKGLSTWSENSSPPDVFLKWPLSAGLPFTITRVKIPGWKNKAFARMVMDSERIVLSSSLSSGETPAVLVATF
ncbi:hypothetical protein DL93DRAFT_500035 [Clavulina sp. PMI_390]|nr:hypothetical protein DL93DRAFT_500035 [Clavulina sp. PMI_390]